MVNQTCSLLGLEWILFTAVPFLKNIFAFCEHDEGVANIGAY